MSEGVNLNTLVTQTLDDMKAVDVKVLDVHDITTITDTMVIASGTSGRHVRAMAEKVVEAAKANGHPPLGTEGEDDGEWVLVDLGEIIVHVMLPRIRDFYNLEKLWDVGDFKKPVGAMLTD